METIKRITRDDMADVALGGAFLGTGGGGDPYIGRLMAEQAIDANGSVQVLDVEDLADDALIVPVAMMGAPTVMLEKLPRGDEAINALRSLEAVLGKKADAIFCIEAGGLEFHDSDRCCRNGRASNRRWGWDGSSVSRIANGVDDHV